MVVACINLIISFVSNIEKANYDLDLFITLVISLKSQEPNLCVKFTKQKQAEKVSFPCQ